MVEVSRISAPGFAEKLFDLSHLTMAGWSSAA